MADDKSIIIFEWCVVGLGAVLAAFGAGVKVGEASKEREKWSIKR